MSRAPEDADKIPHPAHPDADSFVRHLPRRVFSEMNAITLHAANLDPTSLG
jgi:hypothetical protein